MTELGDPTFRRLTDDDLPTLHGWLNEPGVVRWWEGDDLSWEAVVTDYGSECGWDVEHWMMLLDGEPVGWIQCYDVEANPDECEAWIPLGVGTACAGIDYLLGDPALRGRGVGSRLIAAFVDQVLFGLHPEWRRVAAAPYEANQRSWRALARAGFRSLGTVDHGDDPDGDGRLMVRDR